MPARACATESSFSKLAVPQLRFSINTHPYYFQETKNMSLPKHTDIHTTIRAFIQHVLEQPLTQRMLLQRQHNPTDAVYTKRRRVAQRNHVATYVAGVRAVDAAQSLLDAITEVHFCLFIACCISHADVFVRRIFVLVIGLCHGGWSWVRSMRSRVFALESLTRCHGTPATWLVT
jgi:hypothetical protein